MTKTEKTSSQKFMESYAQMEWFIVKYFGQGYFNNLKAAAEAGKDQDAEIALNEVWFHLSDNLFNIMENPKGWSELLSIVER